ncbi:CPBP family intramembrane glutamic endopeptidase [Klenkia sp. PcliD-1-E]|uniref:CPBP family intramembrane glutamic endopeptidase n=1 Tax=Klenkia sp. PcliD-1-E TaxID=2954492 RepID=UPI002098184C|nr:CPBP family intramembrane glutamic endopeptidase [Klenkia sp. PcliD-1-E]MCO7221964.1 CPBP family intramembrane metalloprotease [Klenkia sp. PcliD-1-E]
MNVLGRAPRGRLDRAVLRLAERTPDWLIDPVPRDHRETDAAFRRRRRVTGTFAVLGAGMLGLSLSQKPDSKEFYGLTMAVAGTWVTGGVASGPLHLGWMRSARETVHRPVVTPVLTGAGVFGLFYGAALVARRIPVLNRALTRILRYAHQGNPALVAMTTLTNGVAEEVFFRGALYAAAGTTHPVLKSTTVYGLATTPTRNPALVLASVVMGGLFGWQRKITGGIQAPVLTHLTWSALMLRYLPPLFADQPSIEAETSQQQD